MNHAENFDGFITPDGELVPIEEVDRVLSALTQRTENGAEILQALWGLAGECAERGYPNAALGYYEKIIILVDTPGEKAGVLLEMGQMCERAGDHRAALEAYTKAVDLPQEPGLVSYFIRNNAGYCLNQEGRYREAEVYCQAAITIDPRRHNAHKNLGIALQAQGRYSEAAKSLMVAIMACQEDGRALAHLEALLAAHPEILEEEPGFLQQLVKCYGIE
jgi:tetratricopeptide (TPR) repeat protein